MKKYQVAVLTLLVMAAAITVGCGSSSNPTYSKLPFSSNRTVTPATSLFLMNLDGSSVSPIANAPSNYYSPSVSADLKTLAYSSNNDIWVSNPTSMSPTQLTQNSGTNNYAWLARVSPDGKKVLYDEWNNSTGLYSLWIINAGGTGNTQLVSTPPTGMTNCYTGSFSADSSKIVFACYGATNYGLYTMKADGTQIATVVTQSSELDTPQFSPDGKQIVFISWGTPGAQLKHAFIARHTPYEMRSHNQRPHPDTSGSITSAIASINLDGSNPTLIVPNATATIYIEEVVVLNNNLYYSLYDQNGNTEQIWKSNLDGTGAAKISDGTADDWLDFCWC